MLKGRHVTFLQGLTLRNPISLPPPQVAVVCHVFSLIGIYLLTVLIMLGLRRGWRELTERRQKQLSAARATFLVETHVAMVLNPPRLEDLKRSFSAESLRRIPLFGKRTTPPFF